jgi:hypothetical protein
MKVVILPEVIDGFLELSFVLYEKGYFGFEDAAIQYAVELFEDIKNNLPSKHRRVAPKYFEKIGKGMFYAFFRRSKNTSWYVFFNIYQTNGETVYFVRYVSNNHVIAQYL